MPCMLSLSRLVAPNNDDELLINQAYYHGFQTRDEAETLLPETDGSFLVRLVQVDDHLFYIVSIYWDDKKRHFRIFQTKRRSFYYLNGKAKANVPSLIKYHRCSAKPIDKASGAKLRKAVVRSHFTLFREQLTIGNVIGSGEFGEVRRGKLKLGLISTVDVAIKQTMKTIDANQRKKFLHEANLMMRLRHRNIVRLYGVVIFNDPILIVTDYAAGGCLLARLLAPAGDQPSVTEKLRYGRDICYGMTYLESKLVIHRDLAVKNCLLDKNDTVKIADFGLSLAGGPELKITSGRFPIRYIPPETLKQGIFSHKSDVWAYGCTLFEIWHYPYEEPYLEVQDNHALRKAILYDGLRLVPPEGMPSKMRKLMLACHQTDPEERPTFADIQEKHFGNPARDWKEDLSNCTNFILRILGC